MLLQIFDILYMYMNLYLKFYNIHYRQLCRNHVRPVASRSVQSVTYSLSCPTFIIMQLLNKRAQRALGRSPEEKVNGHRGAKNREPQGHNMNNYGRGPFDDVIY